MKSRFFALGGFAAQCEKSISLPYLGGDVAPSRLTVNGQAELQKGAESALFPQPCRLRRGWKDRPKNLPLSRGDEGVLNRNFILKYDIFMSNWYEIALIHAFRPAEGFTGRGLRLPIPYKNPPSGISLLGEGAGRGILKIYFNITHPGAVGIPSPMVSIVYANMGLSSIQLGRGVFQFYGKFASSQPRLFTAGLGKRPFPPRRELAGPGKTAHSAIYHKTEMHPRGSHAPGSGAIRS